MKIKIQGRWCIGVLAAVAGLAAHAGVRVYRDQAASQIAALQGQCAVLERRLKRLKALQAQSVNLPPAEASLGQRLSQEAALLLQEVCTALGGHNIVIAREESTPGAVPEMHLAYQLTRYRIGLRAPLSAIEIAATLPDRLPHLYRIEGMSCQAQEKGYDITLVLSLIEGVAAR